MQKHRIVIDSTVYLSQEFIKDNNIRIVSLNISNQYDDVYKEADISREFIIEKQHEGDQFKTSAPAPGQFLITYESLLDEGAEAIYYIGLSRELSGTHQSAVLAKNMMDDPDKVVCFDTLQSAYGNEMLVEYLVNLIEQDLSKEDIVTKMNNAIESSGLLFTCENLFSLVRGGRLTIARALIGSVLRMKPIIKMAEGKLGLFTTKRTYKKVFQVIIDEIKESIDEAKELFITITHTYSKNSAEALVEEIKRAFPKATLTFTDRLGPVMTVHVGNKGFGISWYTV